MLRIFWSIFPIGSWFKQKITWYIQLLSWNFQIETRNVNRDVRKISKKQVMHYDPATPYIALVWVVSLQNFRSHVQGSTQKSLIFIDRSEFGFHSEAKVDKFNLNLIERSTIFRVDVKYNILKLYVSVDNRVIMNKS